MDTHGPLERTNHWNPAWVVLWVVVVIVLLGMLVLDVSFWLWLPCAVVLFGVPEALGMLRPHDAFPPLTQVIRQYVPRWLAFTVIYGFVGLAAGNWFDVDNRWGVAAIAGVLGWLTTHFDLTFDHPAAADERKKYTWYAEKVGLTPVSAWLDNHPLPPTAPVAPVAPLAPVAPAP